MAAYALQAHTLVCRFVFSTCKLRDFPEHVPYFWHASSKAVLQQPNTHSSVVAGLHLDEVFSVAEHNTVPTQPICLLGYQKQRSR